jgi:hypothetical protein
MPSKLMQPVLFNPFPLWTQLAIRTVETLAASGQVITSRVGQISRAGANPNARDRREMILMGSEKVKAATQSGLAVATRLQSANLQLFTRAWQQWFASLGAMNALGTSRSVGEALARQNRLLQALSRSGRTTSRLSGDAARLASAALAPMHRASTANARRLTRVKAGFASRR